MKRKLACSLVAIFLFCMSGCSDNAESPIGRQTDPNEASTKNESYYVKARDLKGKGDGTLANPFSSLAEAQTASKAGDIIYIMTTHGDGSLDGGFELKPDQKLIGLGTEGQRIEAIDDNMPAITNTTDHLDGAVLKISRGNEISGIHFIATKYTSILGSENNYSVTNIHHNLFTSSMRGETMTYAVLLQPESGEIKGVAVTDSIFRNSNDMRAIQLLHRGDSTGEYRFERNTFKNLAHNAFHIWSQGKSRIQASILDSTADNIGVGNNNSDSILQHLSNQSKQDILVRNFHYKNTRQVGNDSNCALEAFFEGRLEFREGKCTACELTLKIEDSIFEDSVTDGIQLINFGTNSVLDVQIRNTKILRANPKRVGGAISLRAQNEENKGSRTRLLVENTDIIDSSGFGLVVSDMGEGYTAVIDLGGGKLGSIGRNRIINSHKGAIQATNAKVIAKYNWWGDKAILVDVQGDSAMVEIEPKLEKDPRTR